MFGKSSEEKSKDKTPPTKVEPSTQADTRCATQNQNPEGFDEMIARRFGKPRSALGPGTVIQGKLSFDTPVVIEGKLGGEVYSTETLIVGKLGSVAAQVRVKNLIVAGCITGSGSVVATDSIELLKGGRIEGDIYAKRLIIEEGAFFSGNCRMNQEPPAQSAGTTDQAQTAVKETNLTGEELRRAAEIAKNAKTQPQQQQARPNGTSAPVVQA